ncbi:MAG: hypothetical protein Q7S16_03630 [bacterium]|nr:hypothetical protein [bacterium]
METNEVRTRAKFLQEHREALLKRAALMRSLALAPNSQTQIGSAILLRDGTICCGGNNHEASLCAEGVALTGVGDRGYALRDVVGIAVDGASICWSHLRELHKVDRPEDPILILHHVGGGVTELSINGKILSREPVYLLSPITIG